MTLRDKHSKAMKAHPHELRMWVNVRAEVHDARTGRLLKKIEKHNLVTSAGRNLVRSLLTTADTTALTHMGVGTGTTAPASLDTALETEVARPALTQINNTDTGEFECKLFLDASTANGSDLTEAGLFTASSGGTLFARVTHDAISKSSAITITYTWTVAVNAGTWSVSIPAIG